MNPVTMTPPRTWTARVIDLARISSTGYLLTLSRDDLVFQPGQLINLYGADPLDERSYTICSGVDDPHLDVVFRWIPAGVLTPQLIALRPGDTLPVMGPLGEFTLRDPTPRNLFVATGTGIAPARAYLRSMPNAKLTVLHGVRTSEDLYFRDELSAFDYHSCVSGEPGAGFHGRVTAWLTEARVHTYQAFYLCGANEMIYEVRDKLLGWGIDPSAIYTEAYYYRADD